MKKLFMAVIAVMFMAVPVMAEMYVGVGGIMALENAKIDTSVGNTEGLNLKVGYQINETIAVELNYDRLSTFELCTTDQDIDIETFMVALKVGSRISENVNLYAALGGGIMVVDFIDYHHATDPCVKAGAGVDYFVTDNVSLGVEGSYVWGLNDLSQAEYAMFTAGVAYHF